VARIRLVRHRQTKGAAMDRLDLRTREPALYSTVEYEKKRIGIETSVFARSHENKVRHGASMAGY